MTLGSIAYSGSSRNYHPVAEDEQESGSHSDLRVAMSLRLHLCRSID